MQRSVLALLILAAPGFALAQADPHAGHQPPIPGMDMPGMSMAATPMGQAMTGALGAYPMARESSGTAWQPDASPQVGVMRQAGDWMLMSHVLLNGVIDHQSGPRGDDKDFVSGMVMGMATRSFADGDRLQLRAMFSPDPLMGKSGYPLLLAAGETANGVTPLVDRQHPHELVMELSGSYSHRLPAKDSVFVYAGLPGEPAFGPPAFMHRLSILDSPEAPISHHWLDSTHVVFGVVTAGYVHDAWKVEVSRFKGREPDQDRYDIETPKLDSTALRLSWNPTANLALQASWADVKSPEQLEPDENQKKWSASAIYTVPFGRGGWWSTTAAWGRKSTGGEDLDAWVLESAVKPNDPWTFFARAERTETDELLSVAGHHGPVFDVAKVSAGAIHDWQVSDHVRVGLGGLYAWNLVPAGLEASYGGDRAGMMGFVRLKVQ
jgi:hypothetical protein